MLSPNQDSWSTSNLGGDSTVVGDDGKGKLERWKHGKGWKGYKLNNVEQTLFSKLFGTRYSTDNMVSTKKIITRFLI